MTGRYPELIFCFFLFASLASFAMAGASRMTAIRTRDESADPDPADTLSEGGILFVLLKPSRCEGCGTRLKALDMVPVLSCLFLRGRCRHCGAPFGFSHFFAELGMGGAGVFAAGYLAPQWGLSSPWQWYGAIFFLGLSLSFLLQAAVTDRETGEVWDFSGLWCAVFAGLFLFVVRGGEYVLLMSAAGWGAFMVALTGRLGAGDAAPFAAALSLSASFYPFLPFTPEAMGVYSAFFLVLGISGIMAALIARKRQSELKWAKEGGVSLLKLSQEPFGKVAIPLVPHILIAFVAVSFFAPLYW